MGDKICAWITQEMPRLVGFAGSMSEWQLIGFAVIVGLMAYAMYTAVYNILAQGDAELEPYEDWMDAERWNG